MKKKNALTLVEILTAALILSITFGGLISAFMGSREYAIRADRRLRAVNYAREGLNSLYREVSAATWDATGNPLGASITNATLVNPTGLPNYIVTYDCAAVAGREYRQVNVTANYPAT